MRTAFVHPRGLAALLGLYLCALWGITIEGATAQESTDSANNATVRYLQRRDPVLAADPTAQIVVQGRVVAEDSGAPLTYTNIFVDDTDIGTMAIIDGRFWIRGLVPGTWTIKARYISYEEGAATITVLPGDVVDINFTLGIEPVEFDAFTVRAERKLLSVEETGTARRLSASDIEGLPLDDITEMVALQPGVVLENNQIHIRGGRGDDTQFMVDGIGVKDPLATGRYGLGFNDDLVSEIEVLTGGFSAEYGQAVSGVVNVSTKEGSDRFEGKLTYKSDTWAPDDFNYNTDDARLTLSGPNILWDGLKAIGLKLPGEQTFIVSAGADLSDTYLPTQSLSGPLGSAVVRDEFWSPRAQNNWNVLGKLTWRFDANRKFNFTYGNQQDISLGYFLPSEGFPRKFQNILDNYNVFSAQNILGQGNWKHVLGEDSFYEISVGRQFSRLHSNKNGNDDFRTYTGIGPDDLNTVEIGENTSFTAGAYLGGDADRWYDHYAETWTVKADYAFIGNDYNHFKTGLEYNYSEMQLIDLRGNLSRLPDGFLADSQDIFKVRPHVAAAYIQDRLSYSGLVVNLGLRLDAWAPGAEVDDVMSRPQDFIFIFEEEAQDYQDNTHSVFGRRWKARLSPRVGLSFPISKRDKFFFNYGHFNQWPRYNFVYAQLQTDFATGLQLLGNPNLDPKVTVQYETGIQHEFSGLWSAGLTFYSNDIDGYAQSVQLEEITIDPNDTPDPTDVVPVTVRPVRYFNADAARSVGIELFVEKRTTRWLSGRLSVELQRSTGTNSDANATFLSAQLEQGNPEYESEEGIRSTPLLWDRPWSVAMNFDFRVGRRDKPTLFGWAMPSNWSANLLARAWAGARYTSRIIAADGSTNDSRDRYGELGPYRASLDLKLRKWWDLGRTQRITLFFEGRNLLNHDNYRRVNPWTGAGYFRGNWDGDVASSRELNEYPISTDDYRYVEDRIDPSYRTDPRVLQLGMSYEW